MNNLTSLMLARTTLLLTVYLTLTINAATGQMIWTNDTTRSISLESLHPSFNGFASTKFPTSANYLRFSAPLSKSSSNRFILEVPIYHSKVDFSFLGSSVSDSRTEIGNIYFGFELGKLKAKSPSWAEVSIRLPILGDDAFDSNTLPIALATDPMRLEAGMPELTALSVAWVNKGELGESSYIKFRLGSSLHIFESSFDNDPNVYIDYTLSTGHEAGLANLMFLFTGRTLVNRDVGGFSDASLFQFGLGTTFNLGQLQPGFALKIPVGNLDDLSDRTVGLTLNYNF